MKQLENRILKDGYVLAGNILKVDRFLGDTVDTSLAKALADEWKSIFAEEGVTKILTVDGAGISLASITALCFGVPVVVAKKTADQFSSQEVSAVKVVSFTHGNRYSITVKKDHITENDKVLIIDDFLANGSALRALFTLCENAGATAVGAGIAIEKAYKKGGDELRNLGYRIESLAKIASADDLNGIKFV